MVMVATGWLGGGAFLGEGGKREKRGRRRGRGRDKKEEVSESDGSLTEVSLTTAIDYWCL
jgi:hypothetical protein